MHDFTVLVLPGAYASSVALTLDILAAAAVMAPRVHARKPAWKVCGVVEGPTRLSNSLSMEAKRLPQRAKPDGSTWIVPGLGLGNPKALAARFAQRDAMHAAHALKVQAQAGGTVAASCSAVFLLQAAGLLVNRTVTTTWWLAAHLQQTEPQCVVDANRMVISDGPVWTAGAALAQTDLMLQLLRAKLGAPLADAVSRVLLIDAREAQAPFVIPAMLANGDTLIAQLSTLIETALPNAPSVASIAAKLGLSERTLSRRVHATTGQSTMALIQCVRMRKARALLETSRLSVEQVAERVGYNDATALRRMMRKLSGSTPRQFR